MGQLRILDETDVRRLLDGAAALRLAAEAFRDHGLKQSFLSTPSSLVVEGPPATGFRLRVKGATVPSAGISGVRLLTRFPGSGGRDAHNYCCLYDIETGGLIGLVGERWLSAIRTAASAVVATQLLARPDPRVFALFGAGRIADEVVPLLALAFEPAELRVLARRRKNADVFARRHGAENGFPVRVAASPEQAVRGADVIITLTDADEPFVRAGWLGAGALLCSMGNFNEVDAGVLGEVDRVIVDELDFALEVGDLAAWVRQGRIERTALERRIDAEIGQVACGAKPGRLSPDDRILAIVQGMAIEDVAFAGYVLRRAEQANVGRVTTLPRTTEPPGGRPQ